MTREVLDSDVDYGRRLIDEGSVDEKIIAALCLRGLEPASAANLVADLRDGVKTRPKMILLPRRGSQR